MGEEEEEWVEGRHHPLPADQAEALVIGTARNFFYSAPTVESQDVSDRRHHLL